jgi:hypothetical protein
MNGQCRRRQRQSCYRGRQSHRMLHMDRFGLQHSQRSTASPLVGATLCSPGGRCGECAGKPSRVQCPPRCSCPDRAAACCCARFAWRCELHTQCATCVRALACRVPGCDDRMQSDIILLSKAIPHSRQNLHTLEPSMCLTLCTTAACRHLHRCAAHWPGPHGPRT